MIDRAARDQLALDLRRLASGRITNDAFDEARPETTPDRAVREIGEWGYRLYDDFRTYRLTGKYRLPSKTRRAAARAVLFLRSDRPYEWPDLPVEFSPRNLAVAATGVLLLGMAGTMLYWDLPGGATLWALGLIVVALSAGLLWLGPWGVRGQWRRWRQQGDVSAWPFLYRAELETDRRGKRSRNVRPCGEGDLPR